MQYEKKKPIPEGDRFLANRIRKYVLNPEQDKELEREIRAGKHPGLQCLLSIDEMENH